MNKTFVASRDALREMVQFIKGQAAKVGFQDIDLSRLELVAEEALINIVSYSYPEGSGNINIQCLQPEQTTLKVVITDYGHPFNPIAHAKEVDIEAPLEQRTYGGYGIYFILHVMDEVSYKRENSSNILTLVKTVKTKKNR